MSDQVTMRIDHPILKNHCVYGQHILPGLAYVDLLFQIFRKHGHDYRELELRNLIIFEPLVVAEDYDVVLDIQSRLTQESVWQVTIEGEPRSKSASIGHRKRYATAEMHQGRLVAFEEEIDMEKVRRSGASLLDLERFYEGCRRNELVHTGVMKGNGTLYTAGNALSLEISLNEEGARNANQVMFHPALVDGSAVAAAGAFHSADGSAEGRLFLPLAYESFRASNLLKARCFARIQISSPARNKELFYVTIEYFDDNGKKVAELKNLTGKLVRAPGLINPSREGAVPTRLATPAEQQRAPESPAVQT